MIFGRKKKLPMDKPIPNPPPLAEWTGQEVYVNPSDSNRAARNDARIERIKLVLQEKKLPTPRRQALEDELKKRAAIRVIQGEV